MPYTFKHCFICYKESSSSSVNQDASSVKALNRNAELCRRFCTLASRYFDLDPFHFMPAKTINTKRAYLCDQACDNCVGLLKSFCDVYQQWEYLELQLKWRAHEIAAVMKRVDEKGKDRAILEKKLNKVDQSMVEIDDFRTDFIDTISTMRETSYPLLKVVKLKMEDDDDDDFIAVKVRVPRKERRKRDHDESHITTQNMCEDNIENTVSSNNEKTSIKPGSSASSDLYSTTSEDGKDDECGDRDKEIPNFSKRPKILIKKKESTSVVAEEFHDHDEPNWNSADNPYIDKDCSTSVISSESDQSTVIILNDKTNIENCTSNSVNQYKDDILHIRSGGTSVNDLRNGDKDITTQQHETNDINIVDTSNRYFNYYKQFNHLQYICPFPYCGLKFKTMTRMKVHQKVTGHHFNAVISIVK